MSRAIPISLCLAWAVTVRANEGVDLFDLDLKTLLDVSISTASRVAEPRRKVPGTVYILTRADIRARGYRHLGELLRDLPGVDRHQNSSGSFFNRFGLRGLVGNNKLVVLQDGVRIGAPAGEPLVLADNYPLYAVERVEVAMGPGSALYGADAVSGVVQMFSLRDAPAVSLEAGDQGFRRTDAYFSHEGDLRLRLGVHRQIDDHADLAASYPALFRPGDLLDFTGKVVIPADRRAAFHGRTESEQAIADVAYGNWRLGWIHQGYQHPTGSGDLPEIVDYGGFGAYQLDHLYGERQWYKDGVAEGNLRLQYSDYRMDTGSAFINRFNGFTPGYKYAASQRWRIEGQWLWQLGEHRLILGGDWSRVKAIPKTPDLTRRYDPGRATDRQGLFYPDTDNSLPLQIFELSYRAHSLFLQDTVALTPMVELSGGLHYGHDSNYGTTLTPRLNLNWQAAERWRAGLLFGKAFLAPSPHFSYEHFGSFTGQRDAQDRYIANLMFVPNPALKPERLDSLELNLSHYGDRQEWQFALYHNRLDGLILPQLSPVPVSDFVPGGVIRATGQNANVGDVRATGLDVFGRWRPMERFDLWLAYGYADASLDSAGMTSHLPYVARHKLKAGFSWQLGSNLTLSPTLEASGRSYPLPHARADGVDSAPGYGLLHLFARYRLNSHAELELRVENVADRRWFNVGNSTNAGFAATPQDGRRLALGGGGCFSTLPP
ncbi:TonB-dependent receptor [Chitinimonas arctica]|uniref:TonB-dependent receptor n=1 Tax=Chitinimonas arctica TaxID=2594795 RepID=A0A516SJK2_9NEIS|nr:TonB-dependent receptor [Chitinimonas arctica]QDQ28339.1 TonB-dependent receptor [Chitinimonas arctica]